MLQGLFRFLNVEKDEQTRVGLLLIQSLFLGFFYGALDIGAHALFLSEYSEHMLPQAFVISGIVGITLTMIYTRLQSRISFTKLSWGNLIFVLVCMIILWLGFNWIDRKIWVFVLFVMMGPLNIVAIIGFSGTTSRLFTLRQGKRVFGLVDAGQILGIIISSYTIPLILSLNIPTTDLVLFSGISILAAFVMQAIITRVFDMKDKQVLRIDEKPVIKERFIDLFKNRYTFMMSSFVGFSVIVAFLIHYTFIAVTNAQYPENRELAKFLGYFMGTLTVFTLLIKTLVYGRIMKTYGLKVTLLISPVLISILAIAAVIFGSLLGYTTASASFTFFFLIIALTKLFSKALKDSVEMPSFKVLYLSLDERIRYDVQARVDGTVNEISAVFSGLIMTGLAALAFVRLIHFDYVLLVFVLIWIFIGFRLYGLYQKSLSDALEGLQKSDSTEDDSVITHQRPMQKANLQVDTEFFSRFLEIALDFSDEIHNEWIPGFFHQCNAHQQILFLEYMDEENRIDLLPLVKEALNQHKADAAVQAKADKIFKVLETKAARYSKASIEECMHSKDVLEKDEALRYLAAGTQSFTSIQIQSVLRDPDPRMIIDAIKLAGRLKQTELIPVLVDHLDRPGTFIYAFQSLVQMEHEGLEQLNRAFYKTGLEIPVLRRIIRIMGRIGGKQAIKYLLEKSKYPLRPVVFEVIRALRSLHFQADAETRPHFFTLIEESVRVFAWNLAAEATVRGVWVVPEFKEALHDEHQKSLDFIYKLLAITYDPKTIDHIRHNLEHGSSESVNFALELLDLVIDDEIKPVILPTLNDIPAEEKIKELQDFFPISKTDAETLSLAILNRDVNTISLWTKACALLNLHSYKSEKITDDIVAQMFHPDPVLSELSGRLIYELNQEKFNSCYSRLKNTEKGIFQSLFSRAEQTHGPRPFDRLRMLREAPLFDSLSADNKYILASRIQIADIDGQAPEEFQFPDFSWEASYSINHDTPRNCICVLSGQNILETLFDEPEDMYHYLSGMSRIHSLSSEILSVTNNKT